MFIAALFAIAKRKKKKKTNTNILPQKNRFKKVVSIH